MRAMAAADGAPASPPDARSLPAGEAGVGGEPFRVVPMALADSGVLREARIE
jgi:hypothetical protein